MTIDRRTFLLGALGSAGVSAALAACSASPAATSSTSPTTLPSTTPSTVAPSTSASPSSASSTSASSTRPPPIGPKVVSGSFRSAARNGQTVGWSVAYPYATTDAALPVVIHLHGSGDDHSTLFDKGRMQDFLADHVRRGGTPFVIASIDGGETFWHRRRNGDDPEAMVFNEYLPLLRRRGLTVDRLAFMGVSMGGYGSLLMAGSGRRPSAVAAVASSPCLWTDIRYADAGAFDDEAQFQQFNMANRLGTLVGVAVWIDCGDSDPFSPDDKTFAARLQPAPTTAFGPGEHGWDYWRHMAPKHLAFLGSHLR